jgi:hypothetical protein
MLIDISGPRLVVKHSNIAKSLSKNFLNGHVPLVSSAKDDFCFLLFTFYFAQFSIVKEISDRGRVYTLKFDSNVNLMFAWDSSRFWPFRRSPLSSSFLFFHRILISFFSSGAVYRSRWRKVIYISHISFMMGKVTHMLKLCVLTIVCPQFALIISPL